MARRSEYKEEYDELAENYSLLGATDAEMAGFFGISERTLNRWKKKFPSFCQSLKRGKEIADGRVARSLYSRAVGYSHPDLWIAQFKGQVITHEYIKHYPPDTTAGIFWLKNRKPEVWRDAKQVENNLNVNINDTRDLILQRLSKIRSGERAPEDN